MCGPENPLFTPLLQFTRVPFQAKESVHKTPFWETLWNFSLNSLNFHPNFSSQAPKFGNFQLASPKFGNFQFTSPPPPFQRQIVFRTPHTSEIRAAHPYLKKKVECPPLGDHSHRARKSCQSLQQYYRETCNSLLFSYSQQLPCKGDRTFCVFKWLCTRVTFLHIQIRFFSPVT